MERTVIFIIFCAAANGQIRKHIFISTPKNWSDAQAYCRQHYSDLSFVVSERDQDRLLEAADTECRNGWIGLHRPPGAIDGWMWSGGPEVPYRNWAYGEPNDNDRHAVFVKYNGEWKDGNKNFTMPFYCITLPVLNPKMSWEDALEYCRNNDTDLPDLLSEAELMSTQTLIQLHNNTDPVWIGLRYLNDWMWLNGDPLTYNAWPNGDQDHMCPFRKRCGALTKTKGLKTWDCQDRLNFFCT